ncbi:MAG: hypothetical protein EAZ85_15065 [Bacteroidetes bacterium]|nr:MAG: hypothetical protein EAZ85_15065 [Bacteroidota bacterium]
MIKKPFEQWLYEDVEIEFGIERIKNLNILVNWLAVESKPLPPNLEELRESLSENVENWNEDELKMMFISPLLLHFHFNNLPHYRVFTQRMFTLQTPEVEANGRVEWFVASGKQMPRNPFFFLQEFKPEKNGGNDPLGQLLIAMVDAQIRNNNPAQVLYGCYNIGRIWFFVCGIGRQRICCKSCL